MVGRCANPKCRAQFLYLREGKLFALRHEVHASGVEFFWLCGNCSASPDPKSFLPDGARRVLLPFYHRDDRTEREVRLNSDGALPFLQ